MAVDLLNELISLCKCSVTVTVNDHRDNHQTVQQYIDNYKGWSGLFDNVTHELQAEMVKRDTIVNVQCYPRTPIGFNSVYHWDLEQALAEAIKQVKEQPT